MQLGARRPVGPRFWREAPAALGLLLLCALSLLPGFNRVPPVDRDESRFAQASRQMAVSDRRADWVVPRVQDRPRLNKPPLIYWLQAASARLNSVDAPAPAADSAGVGSLRPMPAERSGWGPRGIGAYRLPSFCCAAIAAFITWRIGRSMFAPGPAWLAAAMLATCLMVCWDARQARADQLLLACTTLAMGGLRELWKREAHLDGLDFARAQPSRRLSWLLPRSRGTLMLWAGITLGVMAKGPITPMVVALTALSLSLLRGRWRWMLRAAPVFGVVLTLACVLPWVLAVANSVGWETYWRTIVDETLGRSVSPSEGHAGPPGYHLVLLAVMFFPGSLFTLAALVRAVRGDRAKHSGGIAPHRGAAASLPGRATHSTATARGSHSVGFFARVRAWGARVRDAELFCLAWLVPSWLVFELVSTKLPHYVLPLYPAVALLTARGLFAADAQARADSSKPPPWHAWIGWGLWLLIGLALSVGVPIGIAWFGGFSRDPGTIAPVAVLIGAAFALLVIAAGLLRAKRFIAAQKAGMLAILLACINAFALVLPGASDLWVSERIARELTRIDPGAQRPIAATGYQEDSLIFSTAGRAERVGAKRLAAWCEANPLGLLVATQGIQPPEGWVPVARVGGINYSIGERVVVVLWERRESR